MNDRAIVVGGGIAGMTAASRLLDAGYPVTLVEAGPTLGGLAAPWHVGDVEWDRFYHVILESDTRTRALLSELELEDEIVWTTARSGMYANGQLHPFSGALDLVRFPGLSLFDKFRFGLTILHGGLTQRQNQYGDPYDKVGVLDYLGKWSGQNVVEAWWRPLLRAKLGDAYAGASAAFIRATIARLFGARRFGFVRGGYKRILDAYERRLRARGAEILVNTRVQRIADLDGHGGDRGERSSDVSERGQVVVTTDRGDLYAARVIVTTPSPIATKIAPLDSEIRTALDADRYIGVVCLSLVTRQSLGNYYLTNVADTSFPFTGVINMSALVEGDASVAAGDEPFHGLGLTYIPKYALASDEIFQKTDETISATFLEQLVRIYPHVQAEDILATRVARAPYVFPFPEQGRVERVQKISRARGRIVVINAARLLSATLNVNDTMNVIEEGLQGLLGDGATTTAENGERIAREATRRAIA